MIDRSKGTGRVVYLVTGIGARPVMLNQFGNPALGEAGVVTLDPMDWVQSGPISISTPGVTQRWAKRPTWVEAGELFETKTEATARWRETIGMPRKAAIEAAERKARHRRLGGEIVCNEH